MATRAATPVQALAVAAAGNFAGPLLMGTAVADTVGGVVIVAPHETLPAVGAALSAAVGWNLPGCRAGRLVWTTAAATNSAVTSGPSRWRPLTTLNTESGSPAEHSRQSSDSPGRFMTTLGCDYGRNTSIVGAQVQSSLPRSRQRSQACRPRAGFGDSGYYVGGTAATAMRGWCRRRRRA
ncbi:inorganic phosphate transporter [Mycolicibacterium aromaticivorans]|uniref:inorganic phosphate transporter n=1 Tax=Mycolicibacterium aromaticivorans TaxID=318425 RepID=UPI001ED9B7ED|nr:inorganic phosphate transporter [Mycolicibacterium aromaticivorans]